MQRRLCEKMEPSDLDASLTPSEGGSEGSWWGATVVGTPPQSHPCEEPCASCHALWLAASGLRALGLVQTQGWVSVPFPCALSRLPVLAGAA